MTVIFQNGIIAVPNQPPKHLDQYKEQQLHIQRLETAVQKLIDENENLSQKIDGLMTNKVVLFADMEDKIASQNDKIASQNDKIAGQAAKIASQNEKIAIQAYKIDIMQDTFDGEFTRKQNELTSKIDETTASVEEIKNTPKAVVSFRATTAKNFPEIAIQTIQHSADPVIWKNIEYNIGSAFNASNGRFTCPHDGIYFFYATAMVNGQNSGEIIINVNERNKAVHSVSGLGYTEYNIDPWASILGSRIERLNGSKKGGAIQLSAQIVVMLRKGDTVVTRMTGTFMWNCDERTYFQGHLLDLL